MSRFRHLVFAPRAACIAITVASLFVPACSGGDGNGDYDAAFTSYKQAAADRASSVGTALAASYLEKLTPEAQEPETAVLKELEGQISEFEKDLCGRITKVADQAGDGDTRRRRLDELSDTSRQLVRDAAGFALLNGAVTAPPDRRDQLLDLLGVKAVSPDGSMLRGADALRDAGLDPQGKMDLPAPGSPAYTKYRDWARLEAPGFDGTVVALTDDIRESIESCISTQ